VPTRTAPTAWARRVWHVASDRHIGRLCPPYISTHLIVVPCAAAQRLDAGPPLLRLEPLSARRLRRPGRSPRHRPHRGLPNQIDQAIERVGAVALLGAVALRRDDEHALAREPLAGEPLEP